jgi:Mg-chelatase subunit ChlD
LQVRINGGTNIAAAITHAGKLLKKNSGCQPHATKIIIVITDGRVDSYQVRS